MSFIQIQIPSTKKKPTTHVDPLNDLILPEVPRERDIRFAGLEDGYVYVSKEQWQEDRDFVKTHLKRVKAEIALKIFDTDTVEKPTTFLRRFWAATGVPKSKELVEVVADLANPTNKKEGWMRVYNKWAAMDPSSKPALSLMSALQEMAIKICRTNQFKKDQQKKKE